MNKKEVCPICHRKLILKHFVYNKLIKKRICERCDKRIGHNKWYISKEKEDHIGKYSLSDLEKKRLWEKYVHQGYSYHMAWRMVYNRINGLRRVREKQRKLKRGLMIKQNENRRKEEGLKKKLVEGLK